MTDPSPAAVRENRGQTHYPGCWQDHLACAVAEVERLRAALQTARASEGLREPIAEVLMLYELDYDGNWPMDKVKSGLRCIVEDHSGDCLKRPWTCMRCEAEHVYNRTDAILAAIRAAAQREGE